MPNGQTTTQPAQPVDHGRTLLSWAFPEFVQYQRGRRWYVITGIIGAGLLVYALFTRNFLFAVILVMVAVIFALRLRRSPRTISVAITEDGLEVGGNFFQYRDVKHFWIAYEPPVTKTLYLEFNTIQPTLGISLENQNPLRVREVLRQYLKEDLTKEDELLSDRLARLFKL